MIAMIEVIKYTFMQKALVIGCVISIACSLLGVFLVLRKYSLLGHGLAHISFGGIAVGLLLGYNPFLSALIFAIIGAIVILRLKRDTELHEDTAIGVISESSLGLGIFIASIASGFNVDLFSYLFGNILVISNNEIYISIILAVVVILTIVIFYNELFYISFDEESARASGINVDFLDTVLILLSAITVVSSMRIIGILLVSSLIIIPASIALQLSYSFKKTLMFSVLIGLTSVIMGLFISYKFDFATSGTIVLLNFLLFVFVSLIKKWNSVGVYKI